MKRTEEQNKNQDFDFSFGEQGKMPIFQETKGTGTPPTPPPLPPFPPTPPGGLIYSLDIFVIWRSPCVTLSPGYIKNLDLTWLVI